jgi:hypothetical protein
MGPPIYAPSEELDPFDDLLGPFLIIPKTGGGHPLLQLCDLLPLVVKVKDTPGAYSVFDRTPVT